jgi:hypothetical protein
MLGSMMTPFRLPTGFPGVCCAEVISAAALKLVLPAAVKAAKRTLLQPSPLQGVMVKFYLEKREVVRVSSATAVSASTVI